MTKYPKLIEIKEVKPIKKGTKLELSDITIIFGPPNTGKSRTIKSIYSKLSLHNYNIRHLVIENIFRHITKLVDLGIDDLYKINTILGVFKISKQFEYIINNPYTKSKVIKSLRKAINLIDLDIVGYDGRRLSINFTIAQVINIKEIVKGIEDSIISHTDTYIDYELVNSKLIPYIINIIKKQPISFILDLESIGNINIKIEFDNANSNVRANIKFEGSIALREIFISKFISKKEKYDELQLIRSYEFDKAIDNLIGKIDNLFLRVFRYYTIHRREVDIQIKETIFSILKKIEPPFDVCFIPYGRSPLIYLTEEQTAPQTFERVFIEDILKFNPIYNSYLALLREGRATIKRGSNTQLIELNTLFRNLLQGELELKEEGLLYKDYREGSVKITQASALAGEVTGIFLPLVNMKNGSIILIEEPESQLHVAAQILMALTILALAKKYNHKFIFTTHSDLLAIIFAAIQSKQNINKKRLADLIKKVCEVQGVPFSNKSVDKLVEFITTDTNIQINFYYYKPDRNLVSVERQSAEDILKKVKSISDTIDIIANWLYGDEDDA